MTAIKLPFSFDAKRIQKDIESLKESGYYQLHNPFLEPGSLVGFHLIEPETIDGFPVFKPNAHLKEAPYLNSIYETFLCDKETFRVHSLRAGSKIKRHRDIARNFENNIIRLHIPVISDDQVYTYLDDKRVKMEPGECWYLDLDLYHEILNEGSQDRVNLVMDCLRNEWWENIFESCGKTDNNDQYAYMSNDELINMLQLFRNMGNQKKIENQIQQELESRNKNELSRIN